MRIIAIVYLFVFLFSCTDRDLYKPFQGFWVSVDYKNGKPFQTLTISTADTSLYGAIPYLIETNQYGAYPHIDPTDTIDGDFEAYDPHWNIDFILKPQGDTLVQIFSLGKRDERKMKYIRMDSIKMWREAIFSDLLLQIDLPHANENDILVPTKSYLVVNLFLGPLKESLRGEHPAISRDSIVLQVNDVLLSPDLLDRFLHAEQSKQDELDRDSMIFVLNADSKMLEQQINGWAKRIKSFNANLSVYRCFIDLKARKFRYRELSADD